ncbi:MAG: DUF4864 domain-containing protein [Candidatus Rokubacteria bacterium]|nr:DUF4864 domain-containing protein [Candidatus Rokubacteria bacterium]MBI3826845.1 DUF4864 domain-containing protein [Candidatus Rokubacteria bacterium]
MIGCAARAGLLLALAIALGPAPARAQDVTGADEAIATVMRQLEAFRRDDFATAYGFASETIRAMFAPESFEAMVRGGYPEIARSARATVDDVTTAPGGLLYVHVRVWGANGKAVEALYEMVREPGGWRINGVVTRPAAPTV